MHLERLHFIATRCNEWKGFMVFVAVVVGEIYVILFFSLGLCCIRCFSHHLNSVYLFVLFAASAADVIAPLRTASITENVFVQQRVFQFLSRQALHASSSLFDETETVVRFQKMNISWWKAISIAFSKKNRSKWQKSCISRLLTRRPAGTNCLLTKIWILFYTFFFNLHCRCVCVCLYALSLN